MGGGGGGGGGALNDQLSLKIKNESLKLNTTAFCKNVYPLCGLRFQVQKLLPLYFVRAWIGDRKAVFV